MENQKSILQRLELCTLFFTNFIESKSALLITIFLTSLASLLHIGYGFYKANESMFFELFGEYYIFGVGIAVITAVIFDLGLVVFSANTKSKFNILIISLAIIYLNYTSFQFHINKEMVVHDWNTFLAIWSVLPVWINVNCVFSFHKKEVISTAPEKPTPKSPEPKTPKIKKAPVFEEIKTEILQTKQGEMTLTKNSSKVKKKKNVQIEMFQVA
jgi:hypothetical protein